jgi:hypothetical protein
MKGALAPMKSSLNSDPNPFTIGSSIPFNFSVLRHPGRDDMTIHHPHMGDLGSDLGEGASSYHPCPGINSNSESKESKKPC